MMFWCWSQSGKCSHFVTAASRHYPPHHQGPYHLLTGDWGIVKPAPAPAPAPLQTAAQGGWPVWPGPGATHGCTTEKIQLFTVSSNSRVQQLWYRCTLIKHNTRRKRLLVPPHLKCIKHFHTLVFKHGHSNAHESGMLFCKDHHIKFKDLCFSKYLFRILKYINRQSMSKLKKTEQFTSQAGG